MKIGTLTFHITSNYGALLQAYALQLVLNRMGHSSEIINYQFPGSENLLCTKFSDCKTVRRKINHFKELVWCVVGPVGYGRRLRISRSIEFINDYIPVSEKIYSTFKDLTKEAVNYDAYITGSDQVWNPNFKETSEGAYLLAFVPTGRLKISYAASFGVPELSPEQYEIYEMALKSFDYISVREQEGVGIVKKATGENAAQLVIDPTMLLRREEWLELAVNNTKYDKYILCYFLDDFDQSREFIQELQERYNLPVIYLGFNKKYLFDSKMRMVSGAGPREFLGLFANATHIVTNSFHGTVFSILFQKSFYCMLGINPTRKAMNGRLLRLSKLFKLNDRIGAYNLIKVSEKPIDYNNIELSLDIERKQSFNFIKKALAG